MSPDVNALSTTAEHSEQGKRRGNREPRAPPAWNSAAMQPDTEAREQTDRGKHRRGSTDRQMGRAMQEGVGKIAAGTG